MLRLAFLNFITFLLISPAMASQGFLPLLQKGLDARAYSNAEVLVFNFDGEVLAHQAVGSSSATKGENVYDLASLSKIFTATAVMRLIEENYLSLSTELGEIFPSVTSSHPDKKNITIEQLLRHRSGLIPSYTASDLNGKNPSEVILKLLRHRLWREKNEEVLYSDTGYTILAKIVEELTGRGLASYLRHSIFNYFEMSQTYYFEAPVNSQLIPSHHDNRFHGRTHDPLARITEQAGGHAGVFSSSKDLMSFLLQFGHKNDSFLMSSTYQQMLQTGPDQIRGLGFDINSSYSRVLEGECLDEKESFNHTGFSGTSFIMDSKNEIGIIILTNRSYSQIESSDSFTALRELRSGVAQRVCQLLSIR